jgi:phage terminase large subunit-like protein
LSELDGVCFSGDSGILAQLLPGELESWNQNKARIRLFNGSILQGYSADIPDRMRGANLSGLWYDEAASSRYPEFWYGAARPAVRIGRARIVVTTTPRNTRLLRDLTSRTDGSVHITVGRMWENDRLDECMAEDLRREYMGTRLGRQELGARKIWLELNRRGIVVARCTVERLMGEWGSAARGPGPMPLSQS